MCASGLTSIRSGGVPFGGGAINALAGVGIALSAELGLPVSELWEMRNGYALCTAGGLDGITRLLGGAEDDLRDELRAQLAIGLHRNVEVTDVRESARRVVSQAFCSALPVAYGSGSPTAWEPFARLVLEASYEALLSAVEQSSAGGSKIVLLTRVGGGAFGNADKWIDDATVRALTIVGHAGLDVRLVSHGRIHDSNRAIAERFNG